MVVMARTNICPRCGGPMGRNATKCGDCRTVEKMGDPVARFWERVDRSGGPDACWPWLGARVWAGYGVTTVHRRQMGAHRFSLELALRRPLAPGVFACHVCDNPPCCNPAHLFEGTNTDNIQDAMAKGRMAVGTLAGPAKLTAEEVQAIRRRLGTGEKQRDIARAFRVCQWTISAINRGQTYRNVA